MAPVKGGVVAAESVIYFGDLSGYLWALNEQTGAVLASKKTGLSFGVGSPIVAGGTLVIGSTSGRIIALPLDNVRSAHD